MTGRCLTPAGYEAAAFPGDGSAGPSLRRT